MELHRGGRCGGQMTCWISVYFRIFDANHSPRERFPRSLSSRSHISLGIESDPVTETRPFPLPFFRPDPGLQPPRLEVDFIAEALEDWEAWSGLHASGLVSEAHQLAHEVGTVIPELPPLSVGQSRSDMEADRWIA